MSIKGLDVSRFQGEVDWERVKAAGYQFAMLRAGYGDNTVLRRHGKKCSAGSRQLHPDRIRIPAGLSGLL